MNSLCGAGKYEEIWMFCFSHYSLTFLWISLERCRREFNNSLLIVNQTRQVRCESGETPCNISEVNKLLFGLFIVHYVVSFRSPPLKSVCCWIDAATNQSLAESKVPRAEGRNYVEKEKRGYREKRCARTIYHRSTSKLLGSNSLRSVAVRPSRRRRIPFFYVAPRPFFFLNRFSTSCFFILFSSRTGRA